MIRKFYYTEIDPIRNKYMYVLCIKILNLESYLYTYLYTYHYSGIPSICFQLPVYKPISEINITMM